MQTKRTRHRQQTSHRRCRWSGRPRHNKRRHKRRRRCRNRCRLRWSGQSTESRRIKQGTVIKDTIGSDDDGNSETRCPTHIVSFFINNMTGHGYSIQLTTEMLKLMKNLLELKQPEATRATAIATPTPNV